MKLFDKEFIITQTIKRTNKNIYLRVKNNEIVISTPRKLSDNQIKDIINKSLDYIEKQIKKSEIKKEMILHFYGIPYKMMIHYNVKNSYLFDKDIIHIFSKKDNIEYIKKLVNNIYKEETFKYLDKNINKFYKLYADILKKEPIYNVKSVKTFYGKCYPKKYELIFSSYLSKYDPLYIDSVICHELTHFKVLNHQKAFYDLYESKFKNAKVIQHKLRMTKYNDYF